jgi:peptide/nickel transport system substrate-binding protein
MIRPTARTAAVIALTGLATAACGTGGTATSTASAGATSQSSLAASDINANATVNIGLVLEPTSLDIATTSGAALDQILLDNIYQGLLTRNDQGQILPSLAASYQESSDGLTYTFQLVHNAKFHDGSALTSADVVWSLDQVIAPKSTNPDASELASVGSVSASGPYTVVLHLKHRDTELTWELTDREAVIFKQGTNLADLTDTENGTGPFKLAGWDHGSSITFVRDDSYWGTAPHVAKVVFHYITTSSTANNAELTGELDVETGVDATLLSSFTGNSAFSVLRGTSTDKFTLAFNNASGPTKDIRVREAIREAVNNAGLIQALGGAATQIGGPVPPSDPWYQDLTSVDAYNPTGAKALLKAAGYGSGLTLSLQIPNIYSTTIGDYLTSELKQVGITLDVHQVQFASWLTDVFEDHDYQLSVVDHAEAHDLSNYANPDYYFGYDNAQVQQWYQEGVTAASATQRDTLWAEAAKQVSEDAASDWLYLSQDLTVVRSGVSGVPVNFTSDRYDLSGIEVAKS